MRVLFLPQRNLHVPHVLPVHQALAAEYPDADIYWVTPKFVPSQKDAPGSGLDFPTRRGLQAQGVRWLGAEKIGEFDPDAVVVADAFSIPALAARGTRFVNVNHGLISKGWFYTDSPGASRENTFDLICVPGPYHERMLKRVVNREIRVCGLVKFDRVFRGEITRASVRAEMGIGDSEKVVLFAPTFNKELSGVPIVTDDVRRWTEAGYTVIVKLHGMSPPEWVELYRLIARVDPQVHLVEDLDLTPSLVAADVVVSDVSSAFMEAAALDRPVVLIDNPARIRYPSFDPRDVEYALRDVGEQVERREDVLPAIEKAFARPEARASQRRNVADNLAGPRDGNAARRVATGIADMAESRRAGLRRAVVA